MSHKWHVVIKEWADGTKIEFRFQTGDGWSNWVPSDSPPWSEVTTMQFRVAPEKKPDVVHIARVQHIGGQVEWRNIFDKDVGGKVQFTFDGETGKLKAVELLT